MMHEHVLEAGGLAQHYAEGLAGGPAIVLLHGGWARWQSWEQLGVHRADDQIGAVDNKRDIARDADWRPRS